MKRFFVMLVATLSLAFCSILPASAGEPLSGAALQQEAIAISKLLRCPASPNVTLYDSETSIASELKGQIYEKLRDGMSREEILTFMAERYGENIRYKPDFNAGTAALWFAPWLAFFAAGFFLVRRVRRTQKQH